MQLAKFGIGDVLQGIFKLFKKTLPKSIKKLQILSLTDNLIEEKEQSRIKRVLKNCEIEF